MNNEEALAKIYELEKMLVEIESEAKRYKALKERMSEFLTKQMEQSGDKTFETEKLKVTRVFPSETTTFDAKALLADMPELAERYNKANKKEKGRILDEFISLTGYNRSY